MHWNARQLNLAPVAGLTTHIYSQVCYAYHRLTLSTLQQLCLQLAKATYMANWNSTALWRYRDKSSQGYSTGGCIWCDKKLVEQVVKYRLFLCRLVRQHILVSNVVQTCTWQIHQRSSTVDQNQHSAPCNTMRYSINTYTRRALFTYMRQAHATVSCIPLKKWLTQNGETIHCSISLPVGQPPVLKLLSRRFWGLSPRRDNTTGMKSVTVKVVGRRIFGVSGPQKTKNCQNWQLFCPTRVNPLPDVGEICRAYAGNRFTEVVNIWCNSIGKLGTYRQKTAMGHYPSKFSDSPSSEITGPIEKIKGVQKWCGHPLFHAKFGVDAPLHSGMRKKC